MNSVREIVEEQKLTLRKSLMIGKSISIFGDNIDYKYDPVQEQVSCTNGKVYSVDEIEMYIDFGLCKVNNFDD